MDEWLKQLQNTLNSAARDSSNWLAEASQEANQAIEVFEQASTETLQEIQSAIEPVVNDITDQLETGLEASFVFIEQRVTPWVQETTAPITHTVNPWLQNHPTCIGCKNYHGSAYGENVLVCGMHPYGPDGESCADWESVWPKDLDLS